MIERCTFPYIHSNRNTSWSSLYCRCLLNSALQPLAKHKLDAAAVRYHALRRKLMMEKKHRIAMLFLVPGSWQVGS